MLTDLSTLTLEELHNLKSMVGGVQRERVERAIAAKASAPVVPLRRRQTPVELDRERDVEWNIIQELERWGFDVVKLSQFGKPKGMTVGTPDLYARHTGRKVRVWIEVKLPGEMPRPEQKSWHRTERDAGGDVMVITSLRDLVDELEARGFAVRDEV